MVRVKRGMFRKKKRRKILGYTKGFKWGRKSKVRLAKEALLHAWTHSYRGRKEKKRNMRRLWQIQVNAGCRTEGLSYSKLIAGMKKNKIEIDRKILADLAQNHSDIFKKVVGAARSSLAAAKS